MKKTLLLYEATQRTIHNSIDKRVVCEDVLIAENYYYFSFCGGCC
jgi:hypothetical protein